jgi:hypothetical protein
MLTLIITSLVSILVAWFSFFLGVINTKRGHYREKSEYIITNFFNPICSLLFENTKLYSNFGPKTFSDFDLDKRAEAGELWESIKEEAIIPNLNSIRKLLIQHQHFHSNRTIKTIYSNLQLHCLAFTLYNKNPNEMYHKYKFNKDWIETIEQDRKEYIRRISNEYKCILASKANERENNLSNIK